MSPIAINWIWFATSFAAFGVLVAGWLRRSQGGGRHDADPHPPGTNDGSPGARPAGQPHMPWPGVDPVSGEPLHMNTALPWFHRGKVYFFASESTRDCFAAMTGSSTHEVKRAPPVGPAAPDVRTIRSPSIQRRP